MRGSKDFVGISNRFKMFIKLGIFAICTAYFLYHAITGRNGLHSYFAITNELTAKQEELHKLKENINVLQNNINMMSKTIDLDLLEEQCRKILNYVYNNDFIVKN